MISPQDLSPFRTSAQVPSIAARRGIHATYGKTFWATLRMMEEVSKIPATRTGGLEIWAWRGIAASWPSRMSDNWAVRRRAKRAADSFARGCEILSMFLPITGVLQGVPSARGPGLGGL